ncbi:MAG: baseplate J/gp47 family protein [Succinivibrio sp.]
MANLRPSISEIIERIENDAQARLDSTQLRRSDLSVFIRVLAGISNGLYDAISYGRKQLFSDTADTTYLERMASIFGLRRKKATRATGTIKFSFSNKVISVDIGTLVQDSNGNQYATTTDVISDGSCTIQAVEPGAGYNIATGVELTLPNSVSGVTGAITTTAITGGAAAETDDELRERVLARTQNPPRQGTKNDYILWCKEVEGVGNAWVYPKEYGEGTITLRFVTSDNTIPDDKLVKKVQEHIDNKAFILAKNYVEKPIAQKINFVLSITPDTIVNRSLAEHAIRDAFAEESRPGGVIYLSHLNAKISAIGSESDHTIVSPASNIVATGAPYMPVVGDITWR